MYGLPGVSLLILIAHECTVSNRDFVTYAVRCGRMLPRRKALSQGTPAERVPQISAHRIKIGDEGVRGG